MPGRPCVRRREIAGNVDCPVRQWLACERGVGLEIGVWKLKIAREKTSWLWRWRVKGNLSREKNSTHWILIESEGWNFRRGSPRQKKQPCAKAEVQEGKIPTCSLSTCKWRFRVHRDHLYAHGWTFLPHVIPPDQRFPGKHIWSPGVIPWQPKISSRVQRCHSLSIISTISSRNFRPLLLHGESWCHILWLKKKIHLALPQHLVGWGCIVWGDLGMRAYWWSVLMMVNRWVFFRKVWPCHLFRPWWPQSQALGHYQHSQPNTINNLSSSQQLSSYL